MRIFRYLWLVSPLLFMSLFVIGSHPVGAQKVAPAKITSFDVTTLDNKPIGDTPLMAGASYKVNFTMEVAAGLNEKCVLKTSMDRSSGSDRFWTLKGDYPGIDPQTWQPGQQSFSFDAVGGTAQLQLEGSIPADYVSESLSNGQTLHISKKMPVVELSFESGTVIADQQMEVIDNSIEQYRNILNTKQELLANTASDPSYSNLVKSLLSSAEAEAKVGQTDLAIGTLNRIPNSGWVAPRKSSYYQWIIIGILAIIAAGSVFMLMKSRSELSFFRRQSDSQAKNLQILAKKASRIGDPSLVAGIEQVRKELEQSEGGS